MRPDRSINISGNALWLLLFLALGVPGAAFAHCDTMSGPVVQDARRALELGDLAPVLKWIRALDEPVVRDAFQNTLIVRTMSDEARRLADRYFFETVVRVHRAGEGAPYEGLKAADSIPPVIVAADQALGERSVETLEREISKAVGAEVRKRFQAALQRKDYADESPEAGREYVAAYVSYVHFVEAVHELLGREGHRLDTGEESHGPPKSPPK